MYYVYNFNDVKLIVNFCDQIVYQLIQVYLNIGGCGCCCLLVLC